MLPGGRPFARNREYDMDKHFRPVSRKWSEVTGDDRRTQETDLTSFFNLVEAHPTNTCALLKPYKGF